MMGVALTSKASVVYCLGVVVLVVLMWSGSTSGNGQSQKKSTEESDVSTWLDKLNIRIMHVYTVNEFIIAIIHIIRYCYVL